MNGNVKNIGDIKNESQGKRGIEVTYKTCNNMISQKIKVDF